MKGPQHGNTYNYYSFDFRNNTLMTFDTYAVGCNNFVMANEKLYYSKDKSVYIQNLKDKNIKSHINLDTIIKKPYYGISQIIKFTNTNDIFLNIADLYYGDEISDEQYYIYDEISRKLILSKNNDILKENINANVNMIQFYDFSGKFLFWTNCIMSSDGNIFSKLKKINADIYGIVISNQETKQFLLKSNLDSQKNKIAVLIPFIPNPFKEKVLYEIYENIELTASDLDRFDAFDLRILRNMIFAKHNYAFNDKFLQAYFNLYSFYSSNYDKNRLTDVSHLLTPEDKKNLELIEQVSKNK
jgi:hypothetical protein